MLAHRVAISLALAITVLASSTLRANAADAAEQLIAKGVELRKRGDHAGALREFQAAHAKEPSGRTLAQMGIAEATLQRWTDAEDHLSQALDEAIPWVQKNRSILEETLQTVRTHTAEVSVYGPSGAVVTIGDKVVGQIPLPNIPRVNEGTVTVRVDSPGHKPFSQTISAQGGARLIVTASLDPILPEPAPVAPPPILLSEGPPPRDAEADFGHWRRWGGIAALTAGVAAMTWGIVWIAVDGNTSSGNPDLVWDTRRPGWFILGGGIAASLGGGYLLYSSHRTEVQVAATPTGLMGRF